MILKNVIQILLFVVIGLTLSCKKETKNIPAEVKVEIKKPIDVKPICYEKNKSINKDCFILECVEDTQKQNKIVTREDKIDEVIMLWNLFFNGNKIKQSDPRRKLFRKYAEYVVDVVEEQKDRLNGYKNMHLLIATFITKESSLKKGKVGKKGEVGLLQTWGVALNKHSKREVQNDPKLSIRVGLNHILSIAEQYCPGSIYDEDWVGAATGFSYSFKSAYTNGKCNKLYVARKRINLVKNYRWRINQRKKNGTSSTK